MEEVRKIEAENRQPAQEQSVILEQGLKKSIKKKHGAPFGNQNARKHGFYSEILTRADRRNLFKAASVDGIDVEISILRMLIRSLLASQPENVSLITKALYTLAKMLPAQNNVGGGNVEKRRQASLNILEDIVLPAGIPLEQVFKQ